MLISKYKVTVKEEPQFASETVQQRHDRVLKSRAGLTVTYVLEYSTKPVSINAHTGLSGCP